MVEKKRRKKARDNIAGSEVPLALAVECGEVLALIRRVCFLNSWLGTLQWVVRFSPHPKGTTTHWEVEGKSGLVSTSLYVPPCGRWCSILTVSRWWPGCALRERHSIIYLTDSMKSKHQCITSQSKMAVCCFPFFLSTKFVVMLFM